MSKVLIPAALVAVASAYTPEMLNATATCSYQATCNAQGYTGVCVDVSSGSGCCNGGTATAGLCPGASNIQCCTTPSCTVGADSGSCMQASQCSGTFTSGAGCTGPTGFGCCVGNSNPVSSVYGVDVSTSISSSTASCFASSYGFIIPRGFKSSGYVDSAVCTTLNNAKNAGIPYRETYLFPCPTCSSSASTQVQTLVNYLNTNCKSSWDGRVWLDIEGSQYWLGSTSSNKNWYQQLVDACNQYAPSCGVYTSSSQWQEIFGSTSYSYGSNLPLWYPHYDNNPSFSDFKAFAGWTTPYMKQYAGDVTACSVGVDKNYCPSL